MGLCRQCSELEYEVVVRLKDGSVATGTHFGWSAPRMMVIGAPEGEHEDDWEFAPGRDIHIPVDDIERVEVVRTRKKVAERPGQYV